jgi:CMP-N,N'-diacetyllegionaminic acid synthase
VADPMRVLIVIPARGGSKRLPRKNVLPLAGKPLISWTIETALEAKVHADVMITSDDDEILTVAELYEIDGVIVYKRPKSLATDSAKTVDVLIDALDASRSLGKIYETLILLQPTSPLRNARDVEMAYELYQKSTPKYTVVSVCKVDHPSAWIGNLTENAFFTGVQLDGKRSQDYQEEYRLNGAIYVMDVDRLIKNGTIYTEKLRAFVMGKDRSIDIDELMDFKICESIVGARKSLENSNLRCN